jgi:hypothetical protein
MAGHVEVSCHNLHGLGAQYFEGLCSVGCGQAVPAGIFQPAHQQITQRALIVHDKYRAILWL